MLNLRLRTAATVLTATLTVSLLGAPPANAAESDADIIVQTLRAVPTETPLMENIDTSGTTELVPEGSSSTEGAAIEDVSDVSVSATGANAIAVDLLSAQDAVAVSVSNGGVEVIDNGDGSKTIPLDRADGSLQVVTVIESPSSPTSYALNLDLPANIALKPAEGGALLATGADGRIVVGAAPAWAFDAVGVAVPTRYVVEGSTITQIVDHRDGEYQYPITADPYLGQRLFSPMTVDRNGTFAGRHVYSGRLTAWGVAVGLGNQGLSIMQREGQAEFTAQWSIVSTTLSLRQQYQCHALFGRTLIGAGVHWDLEMSRPANSNWANVLQHKCNW